MTLRSKVDSDLWDAIAKSYEARDFANAVLDGMHVLTEVLRERSGCDGDGVALAGAALGGTAPKLKVNKLQTESEQNVQRGVESLARGLYQAVRNPRSHGQHLDSEDDATAILLFINYVLKIVREARAPFSLGTFMSRVTESHFVPTQRYAQLLVKEVPAGKRLPVCQQIFIERGGIDVSRARLLYDCLVPNLSEEETAALSEALSDEMVTSEDEATLRFVIGSLGRLLWPSLSEICRLRAEHQLVKSVKEGRFNAKTVKCISGSLGTWAGHITHHISLKDELWRAVAERLRSEDSFARDYALRFFAPYADRAGLQEPPVSLVVALNEGLRAGDIRFKEVVEAYGTAHGGERAEPDPWSEPFIEALNGFENKADTPLTDDDIPF